MAHLSVSRHVSAPADVVYDLVSNLSRMGEWSPETTRISWRGEVTGAVVGARYIGWNRKGRVRWCTQGEVVAADRGRRLAFDVFVGRVPVALWDYLLVPDADGAGCTVTEEWTERRPRWAQVSDRLLGPRTVTNKVGMERTLAALARAAEGVVA